MDVLIKLVHLLILVPEMVEVWLQELASLSQIWSLFSFIQQVFMELDA
jgi:hypothetical protein